MATEGTFAPLKSLIRIIPAIERNLLGGGFLWVILAISYIASTFLVFGEL
jgi:hypothetical protein